MTRPFAKAARPGRAAAWALAAALAVLPAACAEAPAVPAKALQAAVDDDLARRFYEQNRWRAVWTESAEAELAEALEEAPKHGLSQKAFLLPPGAKDDPARREAALTRSALAYAKALANGATDPKASHPIFTLKRNDADVVAGLRRAVKDGGVEAWLKSLPPRDAEYQALSGAYQAELAAIAQAQDPTRIARARQLAVNLERRRWLNRTPPAKRIDVNLVAARLYFHENGAVAWSTRVVPGEPDNPTPQLGETFSQLVVNPPWNVPKSIAEEEILPKGPGYMQAKGMYFEGDRVVQPPGPDSALGLVKFDMQNPHAIYMHDTPAKTTFDQVWRFESHGCVRVEHAVDFARALARASGREAEFDKVLASGETGAVKLAEPMPVRFLYHSAWLENGKVVLGPDVYGWDAAVAARLAPVL